MRRTIEAITLAVIVAVVAYGVGTCSGAKQVGNDALADNAYRLARTMPAKRDSLRVAQAEADKMRAAMGRSEERVEVGDALLGLQLDANRKLLADREATNAQLREALDTTTVEADSFRVMVDRYRDSANTAVVAEMGARFAAQALIRQQDSTMKAFRDAYEAEKCTVLGVDCPSRKTVGVVSAVGTAILLLLLL